MKAPNQEITNPKKNIDKRLIQKINAIVTIDDIKQVLKKIVRSED